MKNKFRRFFMVLTPRFIKKLRVQRKVEKWKKNGRPIPPPHYVKQKVIEQFQKNHQTKIFIETGTYLGDMVEAQKSRFEAVYSIELADNLFRKARKRFRKDKNVTILNGDSGKVLPEIMKNIKKPAIFWLDGHYSGGITAKGDKDCPIFEEIDAIFNNNQFDHILLIDDARCFNGEKDYPTIEQLTNYILNRNAKYKVAVEDDIIRFMVDDN